MIMISTPPSYRKERNGMNTAGAKPAPRGGGKIRRFLVPYSYLCPALILMLVLMVVPMGLVIAYSFMDNVITNPSPEFVGIENYVTVLTDSTFQVALLHTLIYAGSTVACSLVLALCFALMLNSQQFHPFVRGFFRVIYTLPWMFTITIIALIWRLLLDPLGVVNFALDYLGLSSHREWFSSSSTALGSLVFANVWGTTPFFMISLLAGLQSIPTDMYEAAMLDGANGRQQLMYITIPQLTPVISSVCTLGFISGTQVYALIWMITGGGPSNSTEVLGTYTYKLAFNSYKFSLASTSAVVVLLISAVIIITYVSKQKVWN